ncbi:nitrous oxide-stimulated promoter family protein [Clostridium sp. JN-9]|uniref:nitrous oxide-stimulated promoter family protein n=1 Tax=Clostridium sp. JN-9 TaxID=2507159 RepID=UPI000FFDFE91|nr:nitrous oxide-stimulated promoter family protein [Clostridium sp. JN-9]QAT40303.1 nitrous oxide-stimulated promoter family protein [Clostridium sp. JN-9]
MENNNKIIREKETVAAMIKLYCNKNHNTKNQLCTDCLELKEYALKRLDGCKFGENKTNCGDCKIHCYKKDMKEKIIKVMRYSGPRMIIYHPVMSIEHLISKFKKR